MLSQLQSPTQTKANHWPSVTFWATNTHAINLEILKNTNIKSNNLQYVACFADPHQLPLKQQIHIQIQIQIHIQIQIQIHLSIHIQIHIYIQGVFLTGTPPKSSKYKKVNLG